MPSGRLPSLAAAPQLTRRSHCRPPDRVSTCELEVDGRAEDILNRGERLRLPLGTAPPDTRLVESLGRMWDEEHLRCDAVTCISN